MQRLYYFSIILMSFLTACMPAPITLVPPNTLAAQTMAAMPKTDTPIPTFTVLPTASPTSHEGPPTPILDLSIPGAYCLPVEAPRSQALVTRVLSADTIEVLMTNRTYSVHLIGVNAPSMLAPAEWQSAQAMNFVQNLVEGKFVSLVQDQTEIDSMGYLPRYMLIGHDFVNYEILRQGYGTVLESPPDTACTNSFISAQVEAQSNIRGVWIATPSPTSTITPTPTKTKKPTKTPIPACNCLGPRLTCNNFRTQSQAQQCFEYCRSQGFGDIFGLDKNNNGVACEGSSSLFSICFSNPNQN